MAPRFPFSLAFLVLFLSLPLSRAQTGDCNSFAADLVFLVDASVDVSPVVDFVTKVVQLLNIADDAVKVALVTYGDSVTVEFGLNEHTSQDQVTDSIKVTETTGSGALDKALLSLINDVFADGKGNRDNVGDVVILIANKTSNNPIDTIEALNLIRAENYTIFTIGVDDSDELDAISSKPTSIFSSRVDSFRDLIATVNEFTSGLCEAFIPVDMTSAADASCKSFKADVVFALDSSLSVKRPNFEKMLDFVEKIIESMAIGEDGVRVGLFTYGTDVVLRFGLGDHSSKAEILEAVKAITYTGGLTYTDLALDFLKSDMFKSSKNRPDVVDIVIFLSDGKSTKSDATIAALGRIQPEGYTIFTLGISDKIDKNELNAISSDPDSTYSVEVGDFNDLQGILDAFASQICEETFEPSCEEEQADIVLVVDSSGSIKRNNFEKMKKFLINLIKEFKVSSDGVRVGLLGFAKDTTVEFHLNTHSSKGAVLAGISNMKYTRGKTYTDKALKRLREEMLTADNGNREDVKDIVIFLSDGRSTEPEDTKEEVEKLKQENYVVFAIGIGDRVDTDELNSISSDPDSFFTSLVDDFNGLDEIKNAFTTKTCKVDPPQVTTTEATPDKCQTKADVAIIMDASSSIGDKNFVKMRKFVKDLIGSFEVGKDDVQISLIVFNSEAYVEFYFNTYDNVDEMLLAVDNSHDISRGTYTNLAIQKAREEVFTKTKGQRDNVPKITVLLTDGRSVQPTTTSAEAENLRKMDVTILALGIGNGVDEVELKSIASDPDDKNVQKAVDFDALSGALENLVRVTCDVEPPQVTTTEATPDKCQTKADVAIIMDASSSIGDKNFVKMRKFVKDLIGSFEVGKDDVQISLIVFNSEAYVEFYFNTYDNVDEMLLAVDNSHDISRGTYTNLAIQKAREEVFTKTKGQRDNVPKITVLLTDGRSVQPTTTSAEAENLRKMDVTILALGIGNGVDEVELKSIASDPDDKNVQKAVDFDALSGALENLVRVTCDVEPPQVTTTEATPDKCQTKADVAIIMDASSSIGDKNFVKMRKFVKDLIGSFEVGKDDVQISLIVFNSEAYVEFYFNTYDNVDEMLLAVDNSHDISRGTYTNLAIQKAREEVFTKTKGQRDNVPKITVLLTDGRSVQPTTTSAEAENLRKMDVTILALGIGNGVDEVELKSIASDPDDKNVQKAVDFDALSGALENLVRVTCDVEPPQVTTTEATPDKCQTKADVAIIMDASSSIGDKNFVKMRKFVKDLIGSFEVGKDDVQISLIVFNSEAYVEFYFNTYDNVDKMLLAVDNSHDISRGTYTNLAIQKAREEVFTKTKGQRDNVPKITVLLTDGRSVQPTTTSAEAENLRKMDVTILALGIGNGVDEVELKSIASDPDDKNVQKAVDFDALSGALENLVRVTCDVEPPQVTTTEATPDKCQTKADVAIIMDASSSIGDKNFVKMRKFVKDLIGSFEVGKDDVQISLIVFNSEAYVEFYFNTYDNVDKMLLAVDNSHDISRGTYTHLAIQKAREEVFTKTKGQRDNVPRIAVLLTDGRSTQSAMTDAEAENLRKMDVTILALGIGNGVDEVELKSIASDPDDKNVQRAVDFDALSGVLENLVKVTCDVINATDPNVDPPEENCTATGDLVLVVDVSTSIGLANLDKIKSLLKDILRGLEVAEDKIRVALVTYDILPKALHRLNDEQSIDSLTEAIDKISNLGYGSWSDRAFHLIRTEILQQSGGERPQSNDVIIIFSDGISRDAEKAIEEAEKLRENGAKIITVGSNGYNRGSLRALSSAPSEDHSFTVNDFGGMQQIRRLLTDKRCPRLSNCGVEADIVIVMDASTSIDKEDFEKMKEFVKHLLSGFEIGPSRVRVGLTTFNYDALIEFQLKTFATKRQVLKAVDAVSGRGADTRTDIALNVVRKVMLTEDNGNRPDVSDVVIVLTDGRSKNRENTINEALELQKEGVKIFAIGIGSRISETELTAIATSPKEVYEVENFDGLSNIEASLQRKTCGMMPTDMSGGLKLQTDIVFCFESSEKVSETVFEKTIDMAKHIVKSVIVSKRWTRFGAMKFSSDAVMEMTLDSYFNRPDILLALDQIERNGRGCRVEKALRQLRTLAFKACLGGRAEVPDVAIIFTSGAFEQVDAARYEALLARNAGIKIFAVGIGHDVDKFQLEILSSSPYSNTVFVGETKDELMALINQLMYELDSGFNVCH